MEHHSFNQTVTILQHEGHNIFKYLNSDEYKKVGVQIAINYSVNVVYVATTRFKMVKCHYGASPSLNQTVTILQHEGHDIFKYLNSDEYKKVGV